MATNSFLKDFIESGNYQKMKKTDKLKLVLMQNYKTVDCKNKLLMFTLDNQID